MHTDPDLLALLALGEDVATADELDHLAACPECAARRASLAAAVAAGRSAFPAEALAQPSDRVWRNISVELGLAGPGAESSAPAGEASTAGAVPPSAATAANRPPVATPNSDAPVDLETRRSPRGDSSPRRWIPWLAAAAIVVVGGGIVASIALQGAEPAPTPSPGAVLAEATLEALPGWPDAIGDAVVRESDGQRTIEVSIASDVPDDGYREVWLISSDLNKLVSVGLLPGDQGSFAIPAGIDLDEYSVVDVSAEPLDGDPGHSSDSIVRGALTS